MTEIRRIVLDVLKPHSPSIVELSKKIAALKGVQGVNCTIEEVDQETESLRVTIEGDSVDYEDLIHEKADGVATITLNRPHALNAISLPMLASILPSRLCPASIYQR